MEQECIPVECVPPAAVAVGGWGSTSVHAGIHPPGCGPLDPPPGVGLETPWVWAWRPHWPDPSTFPLGVGLETPSPHWPDPSTSPLAVGLETCNACLGYQHYPCEQNH